MVASNDVSDGDCKLKPCSAAELLPCPFCGQKPQVTNSLSSKFMIRRIECQNESCGVRAAAFGCSQFEDQLHTDCNERWNTRADVAPVQVVDGLEDAINLVSAADYEAYGPEFRIVIEAARIQLEAQRTAQQLQKGE